MNLDELRRGIDETDKELVALFRKRMKLSRLVGEYKKSQGLPIHDPVREAQIIERIAQSAGSDYESLKELYTKIFEISRNAQK